MRIFNKKLLLVLLISALAFLSSCTRTRNITYSGKVIDSETLEPINGVAVAGEWSKWGGGGFFYHYKDYYVKEILTDENGEWEIVGPEVSRTSDATNFEIIRTIFFGYIKEPPTFVFFKPMYCKDIQIKAHPYFSSKKNQHGIIFQRIGKELDAIYKEYNRNSSYSYDYDDWPFIAVDNPEQKLKNLQFSFQHLDNQELVHISPKDKKHELYKVVGLKKAKTWEEIRQSTYVKVPGGSEKSPILYQMREDAIKQVREYRREK